MESQVAPGRKVLRLNLDETAVRFYYKPQNGLVAGRDSGCSRSPKSIVQKAGQAQQKKALTHIGIICDRPELQPRLPQIVLGNGYVLRQRDMARLTRCASRPVCLWRRKSAWIDAKGMVLVLRKLGEALKPLLGEYQPVLLMDAHKVHFHASVLREAAKQEIWPICVPACLTWLLQPLDTDCFARYKQFLRNRYTELLSRQAAGELDPEAVIQCINGACRYVLQAHEWHRIFVKNGYEAGQGGVRESIKEELQWDVVPPVTSGLPSLQQLQSCFPAGFDIPLGELFRSVVPNSVPPAPCRASAAGASSAGVVVVEEPWSKRLRPRRSSQELEADPPLPPAPPAPAGPSASSSSSGPCPPTAPPLAVLCLSPPPAATAYEPPRLVRLGPPLSSCSPPPAAP